MTVQLSTNLNTGHGRYSEPLFPSCLTSLKDGPLKYIDIKKSFSFLGSSHHSDNRLHLAGSGSGSESASDGNGMTSSLINGRAPSIAASRHQQQHIAALQNTRHSNQALNRDGMGKI